MIGESPLVWQGDFMAYMDFLKGAISNRMDTANQFERSFVALVVEMAKEKFGSQSAFARRVFTEKDKVGKWRSIRNQSKKGIPQPLRFDEAIKIAEVLESDIETLCWKIRQLLKDEKKTMIPPIESKSKPAQRSA
jgi:hypothetical protein